MTTERETENSINGGLISADYESFTDAATITDSFEERQTGFATLKSCDVQKGDEGILSELGKVDANQQAYVFEAELGTGETVKVVCSTNRKSGDNKALRFWCDASSISEVAMEEVPVYRIHNGIYRVDGFEIEELGTIPFRVLDKILHTKIMTYENGVWRETKVGYIILYLSILMFLTIPAYVGMLLHPAISVAYLAVAVVMLVYNKRNCMLGDYNSRGF